MLKEHGNKKQQNEALLHKQIDEKAKLMKDSLGEGNKRLQAASQGKDVRDQTSSKLEKVTSEAVSSQLLDANKTIESFKTDMARLKESIAGKERVIEKQNGEMKGMTDNLKKLTAQLTKSQMINNWQRAELEKISKERDDEKKKNTGLCSQVSSLISQERQNEDVISLFRTQNQELRTQNQELRNEVEYTKRRNTWISDSYRTVRQELEEARIENERLERSHQDQLMMLQRSHDVRLNVLRTMVERLLRRRRGALVNPVPPAPPVGPTPTLDDSEIVPGSLDI